jgi:protein-tyrosine phosphatase
MAHIDFDGIENFRDFGGYPTACGRGLRRGVLYRSAAHSQATEADLTRLAALGIRHIVDLRQPHERQRDPCRRWEGFDAEVIENDTLSIHPDWASVVRDGPLTDAWFFEDTLGYHRRSAFEPRHQELFAQYFRALARAEGAVLVHCAAGKDRTGLVCALTHHIAGVAFEDTLHDFLLTNDEARIERKMEFLGTWLLEHAGRRPSDAALRMAVSVQPEYLQESFAAIRAAHGSIDGYLEDVLGVGAAMREAIHDRVLA